MFAEFVSQNIIWVIAFLVVFNLWIWSLLQGRVSGVKNVAAMMVPALQRNGDSVIIDVSPANNYAEAHIPDSINFPVADINDGNSELMKHKDKVVILTCQTGAQSSKAARLLRGLGFNDLHILTGGLTGWTKDNLPLERS